MDLKDVQINFICPNVDGFYEKGQLRLALPFYADFCHHLPPVVKLHDPSSLVWKGTYYKKSKCITDLDSMMTFYGIKPYHMVLLSYEGGPNFKFQVYNPYAVEMPYFMGNHACNVDLNCNPVETDKLACTFSYNAFANFSEILRFVIKPEHVLGCTFTEVLARHECEKIGLGESGSKITLGFEEQDWEIEVKWALGSALFGQQWNFFVMDAKVSVGDTIVLQSTEEPMKYQIAIFEAGLLEYKDGSKGASNGCSLYQKFFKVVSDHTLDFGQLEVPKVFASRYGGEITKHVNICLGGGMNAKFKYCPAENKFYGMHRFLKKYEVHEQFLLLFNYKGSSTFELSVFDTQWMNHFRNCFGNFRFEDFMFPPPDAEVLKVSESMEVISNDYYSDMDSSTDSDSGMTTESSESDEDSDDLGNEDGILTFSVKIKKSHLDQRCHGAYLGKKLARVYGAWDKRTVTSINLHGHEWVVETLRTGKQCRFSIGWDSFIRDNNIRMNEELLFQYLGNFHFEVIKV